VDVSALRRQSLLLDWFEDANKNILKFERDAHLALQRLSTSDGQGLQFSSDAQARITEATDSSGNRVSYEYDKAGCLSRVRRADGREEVYSYDAAHHMTAVSISPRPGEPPRTILNAEYDSAGRAMRQILPNGNTYTMEYVNVGTEHVHSVKVTDPAGRVLDVVISDRDYTATMKPVRFPAITRAFTAHKIAGSEK
jgi:YD repeat-containing protein